MTNDPKRKRSPWYALYPDDFDGGTADMSLAAIGAFLRLLNYQFARKCVPKCDSKICRILRALPSEWDSIKGEVLSKFEDDGNGGLINPRMEKERLEREGIREKRIEAGRIGNDKKHQNARKCAPLSAPLSDAFALLLPDATPATSTSAPNPPKSPKGEWAPDDSQIRVSGWFNRRPTTPWSAKELRAWATADKSPESLDLLAAYYTADLPEQEDYRRRDLATLLNNWNGEIDRARKFRKQSDEQSGPIEF